MKPKIHTFSAYDGRGGEPRISHDLRDIRDVEVALTTDPIAALLPVFRLEGDRGPWMGAFVEQRFVTTDAPALVPIRGTIARGQSPAAAMAAAYETLVGEPTNPRRIKYVGEEFPLPEVASTTVHLGVLILAQRPATIDALRTTRSPRTSIVVADLEGLKRTRSYHGLASLSSLALRLVDEAARTVQL